MQHTVKNTFLSFPYITWVLLLSDAIAVSLAFTGAYVLRVLFPGSLDIYVYFSLFPVLIIFPILYGLLRLYPALFLHPAKELKFLSLATSAGFLLMAMLFFLLKSTDEFSRVFFLLAWALALFLVPYSRHVVRRKFDSRSWWCVPVVVIAKTTSIELLRQRFCRSGLAGLRIVARFSPDSSGGEESGVCVGDKPVFVYHIDLNESNDAIYAAIASQYPHAIVAVLLDDIELALQERVLNEVGQFFCQTIIIPRVSWHYCIPEQVVSLQDAFGLTIRRNLADGRRLRVKRLLDLIVTCVGGVLVLPVFVVLSLLIYVDNPGPVVFRQSRVGRGGKPFMIYKFRTMVTNADEVLANYLAKNPDAAHEWHMQQKLRVDPRITRIGNFLRRTSLDELPQIYNVLRGEMSLVGPRPIVEAEAKKYAKDYWFYTRVLPGMTGLWQVSGRSNTTYAERIMLDRMYITNWSVWLDIYIIIKTFPEVLTKHGAY